LSEMEKYAVGINVGGTRIAAGVLDSSKNMLSIHVTKEHAGQLPNQVVYAIDRAYFRALSGASIAPGEDASVGLSFARETDGLHEVFSPVRTCRRVTGFRCAISSLRVNFISRSATPVFFVSSFLLASFVLIADSCVVWMAAVLIALKDRGRGATPAELHTETP